MVRYADKVVRSQSAKYRQASAQERETQYIEWVRPKVEGKIILRKEMEERKAKEERERIVREWEKNKKEDEEERKAVEERAVEDYRRRIQAEREEEGERSESKLQKEMYSRLRRSGFQDNQVDAVMDPNDPRTGATQVKEQYAEDDLAAQKSSRPFWSRIRHSAAAAKKICNKRLTEGASLVK